jgi:hypothetical protein
MYDASNRKDIRRAEKEALAAEVSRLDYLKAAMTVPQARRWFYELLELCHVFNDPFTGDPLREAYSKGERNVGLFIYSDLVAHCPDDFITMMKEANGRRTERSVRDSIAHPDPDATAPERSGSQTTGWDAEGRWDTANLADIGFDGPTGAN